MVVNPRFIVEFQCCLSELQLSEISPRRPFMAVGCNISAGLSVCKGLFPLRLRVALRGER